MGVSVTTQEAISDLTYFSSPGQLFTGAGTSRFRFPFDATLLGVSAAAGIAPVGGPIILDVNKNGTSVFPAPVAATYRAFSSSTGTWNPAGVPLPTGTAVGDTLVLAIYHEYDNAAAAPAVTFPPGFVLRGSYDVELISWLNGRVLMATKVADGTEDMTLLTTFSGTPASLSWKFWCVAFPDAPIFAGASIDGSYVPTGSPYSSSVLGSIIMPAPGGALLLLVEAANTPSLPTGMTSLVSTADVRLAYELVAAAGPTGSRTSTFTATGNHRAIMVGVAPRQRSQPTIPAGTNATDVEVVPVTTAVVASDYLTVDVDQAGLGGDLAGSDLSVFVRYRRR